MITPLGKKIYRDLRKMRGQALAIVLIIMGGVAVFVMSLSTLDSLRLTRSTYYNDYRFADVFLSIKRAPESLKVRIEELPGVEVVQTRVVAPASVDIEGFGDPVTGRIISIPEAGEPVLNALYLRSGRYVRPGHDDEVLLAEAFADEHSIKPGETIRVTVNGRRKNFTVAGIALTPEYVFQLAPGALFPDYKRYAVMWMARPALATAYDMEGAFNDVTVKLAKNAVAEETVERIDALVEPYGGLGAYTREDQISNRYLSEEFRQLAQLATMIPTIFLAVAAFLLNVVMSRMVSTQREQVAILKAFGYTNLDIGLHYLKLVMIIAVIGVAAGVALGAWLGQGLSNMYMDFYKFPYIEYLVLPRVVALASLVSGGAVIVGTIFAVRRAALLPPAEAMRPEPPVSYRAAVIERIGFQRLLSQPSRMILRHIERRPVKSALTVTGIALACAVVILGSFFRDSIDFMVKVQFNLTQREDLSVSFVEPTSSRALYELESLPGVIKGEPFRAVPVRLRHEHRTYRTSLTGMEAVPKLQRLLDDKFAQVELPQEGVVLTDYLGLILGVKPGDILRVEILEGSRPIREVPVAALVKQYIGVSAYMELSALNRLMREGNAITGANLATDSAFKADLYERIKDMPRVAGSVARRDAIKNFYDAMAEQIFIFLFFILILAGTIAFGVVYNSARIALSERQRELASLRVLGYTRGEISFILLGELAVLTLAALPLGFLIGKGLGSYMLLAMQTDLYRIPLVIDNSTYAFAAVVVLASAVFSALIVRRKLDTLDLVEVLKTKE